MRVLVVNNAGCMRVLVVNNTNCMPVLVENRANCVSLRVVFLLVIYMQTKICVGIILHASQNMFGAYGLNKG